MLKLFQWMLCALGLAVLVVMGLTYRIHGQTLADRVCEVFNSPGCAEWVQRERLDAQSLERNVIAASQPEVGDAGVPHPIAETKPRAAAPSMPPSPPQEEKKPLDSVTSHERQTLDKLLSSRGSK
jgi:hypothetical protein